MELLLKLIKGFANFFLVFALFFVLGEYGYYHRLGSGAPFLAYSIDEFAIIASIGFVLAGLTFVSVRKFFKFLYLIGLGIAVYTSIWRVLDLFEAGTALGVFHYTIFYFLIVCAAILNLGIEAGLYVYFTPETFIENTIPVLLVKDLAASLKFYTDILGFDVEWGSEEGDTMGSVSQNGCGIMLRQVAAAEWYPGMAWIGMKDDTLFEEWEIEDAAVLQPAADQPWAYDMKFADVDGNVLWLGTGKASR